MTKHQSLSQPDPRNTVEPRSIERSVEGFARRSIRPGALAAPPRTYGLQRKNGKTPVNNQPLHPQSKTQYKTALD